MRTGSLYLASDLAATRSFHSLKVLSILERKSRFSMKARTFPVKRKCHPTLFFFFLQNRKQQQHFIIFFFRNCSIQMLTHPLLVFRNLFFSLDIKTLINIGRAMSSKTFFDPDFQLLVIWKLG